MRLAEALRRVVHSLFAGALACVLVALLEAVWARASAGADKPSLGAALIAALGLLAPVPLFVSALVGVAALWLSPHEPPSLGAYVAELRRRAAGRQADVAAFAPLSVLAAFLWTTLVAHAARGVLGLPIAPKMAGLAIMGASLGLGLMLSVLTFAAVPPLRRGLALLAANRPLWVDPAVTAGGALVGVLALLLVGMASGTVSGEGGFLAIYGVFKRPELDLRAPFELLFVAGAAAAAQNVAKPPRTPQRATLIALALASLVPLGFTSRAGTALERAPVLAQAIERGAPMCRLLLSSYRRLTDADRDGFSARFGGGDCDDQNPAIHPDAEELLDNGVDEDCSGADLTRQTVEALAPATAAVAVDQRLFPSDLNVVLITVDTLRADLGFTGYRRPISPNIDALAARAAVFDRAYSLASYTGKSIGPMLIGKYGSETNRNWGHFNKFSESDTFLAERLKRSGVRTMAVHAHRYFDEFGGLDRGFDVLDFSAAPPKDAPWDVDTKATSEQLSDAAIALFSKEENTSGRFFAWIHYLDPHADYLRHEGIDFGSGPRDMYDGEVAFTDKHVGRVLEAISQASWGKRTAVIITSDHGEAFGEHNMYRHGFEVWESLVHVPLVVYVPGAKPKHIAVRRSHVDLAPTILELMHVERPKADAEGTDFLSGQSFLSDVVTDAPPMARDVLVDMPAGPYNDARRALIHDDLKLIVSGESRYDLFDLAADPGEERNLADKAAGQEGKVSDMKERYAALKARLREVKVTGKRK